MTYEEASEAAAGVWRQQGQDNRATRWTKCSKKSKKSEGPDEKAAGGECFGDGSGSRWGGEGGRQRPWAVRRSSRKISMDLVRSCGQAVGVLMCFCFPWTSLAQIFSTYDIVGPFLLLSISCYPAMIWITYESWQKDKKNPVSCIFCLEKQDNLHHHQSSCGQPPTDNPVTSFQCSVFCHLVTWTLCSGHNVFFFV